MEIGIKRFSFRHFNAGLRSLIFRKLNPKSPWWSKAAVKQCDKLLKSSDSVLEFGSGRSTLWFLERCASIISIEHNEKWYYIIKDRIEKMGSQKKVNLSFIPISQGIDGFDQDYVKYVRNFSSSNYDIILIDGKYRAHATKCSLRLIRPGGVLIIDDVQRYLPQKRFNHDFPENDFKLIWQSVYEEINGWRCIWETDGIHCTGFYIKP